MRERRPSRHNVPVPFPDEPSAHGVQVVPHRDEWADEGGHLVDRLWTLLPEATAIDHIGSTSVPGMPAKDCIDVMVQVASVLGADVEPLLDAGFRERPEPWNRTELLDGSEHAKRVFAPPVGGRSMNIHVRETGSPTARYSLLFRDYLRADAESRRAWGELKVRLGATEADIYSYGQVKAAVQPLLMRLAERWAEETAWHA